MADMKYHYYISDKIIVIVSAINILITSIEYITYYYIKDRAFAKRLKFKRKKLFFWTFL